MEERSVHQGIAQATGSADDIRLYFSDQENLLRINGIICSFLKRSALRFLSEAALKDSAWEILNDVMETALVKAEDYRGGSVVAWVRTIALNRVMQTQDRVIKHQKREPSLEGLSERSVNPDEQSAFYGYFQAHLQEDPQQQVAVREQLAMAFAVLLPEDREIVLLYSLHGYSHHEIAQRQGISDGAVRVRYVRALERLRIAWRQLENGKRGENDE